MVIFAVYYYVFSLWLLDKVGSTWSRKEKYDTTTSHCFCRRISVHEWVVLSEEGERRE